MLIVNCEKNIAIDKGINYNNVECFGNMNFYENDGNEFIIYLFLN